MNNISYRLSDDNDIVENKNQSIPGKVIELISDNLTDKALQYDGHGIYDTDKNRIATISLDLYSMKSGRLIRNKLHDYYGQLFAISPQLLKALRLATRHIRKTDTDINRKDLKYINAVLKEAELLSKI